MARARIGLIGLGVMGRNLALNIADHGFDIAVHNRTSKRIGDFIASAGDLAPRIVGCATPRELVEALSRPRAIILMIKAGAPVDATIETLSGLLEPGDIIIDAGNADFNDTRRREGALAREGLSFIGMGVSGGEVGARFGPSIMVGGKAESYAAIRDIIEAIAAKYDGAPCAAHLGPDGAGHFVKTVHNGIEYADMQLIAEVYGVFRDAENRPAASIGEVFERWNDGALKSYLIEITGKILKTRDDATGRPIVDVIVDAAGQKGTGRWTAIEALKLGQSPSTIEAAVAARSWSSRRTARAQGQALFRSDAQAPGDADTAPALSEVDLESALLAGRIIAYSQGFTLLQAASDAFDWGLDLARIAEIWRAGCIIRSAMLNDMAAAVRAGLAEGMLIHAPGFRDRIKAGLPALRKVVAAGALRRLPLPAFSSALAYFDTMAQARGTTNLIQAQRDFFGAHGFERLDGGSGRHGPWALDP